MNDDSCNSTKLTIPKPPHPVNRQKKLPWQCHKEIIDDAEAADRIQQIMENPAYRQADSDVDFLRHNNSRGAHLQLDYSKPELLLQEQDKVFSNGISLMISRYSVKAKQRNPFNNK